MFVSGMILKKMYFRTSVTNVEIALGSRHKAVHRKRFKIMISISESVDIFKSKK